VSYKKFLEKYKKIAEFILDEIPIGFSWHDKKVKSPVFKEAPLNSDIIRQEFENTKYQLGTLGGGNHFIEFQKDDKDFLYLTIHSGSRNLGKKTADYYHFKALKESENGELSYLSIRSLYGREYLSAMNYCVKFAKENRKIMSDKIVSKTCKILNCETEFIADVIHNYASFEKIDEKELVIHRKGAVKAYKDDVLIIPGSMGSATYIAKGLGNKLSFYSASHGAGRKISRRQAKKNLDYDKIISDMKSKGILVYSKSKKGFLEEAPEVYKDIEQVLKYEDEMVTPILKLEPFLVIKG
jgi:tRNA-splicing ligase RtcB